MQSQEINQLFPLTTATTFPLNLTNPNQHKKFISTASSYSIIQNQLSLSVFIELINWSVLIEALSAHYGSMAKEGEATNQFSNSK